MIRLLPRNIASQSREICCEISLVSLNGNPSYHALSYTWGDPNVTGHILLDGAAALAVTENLESALQHLRPSPNEEPLCIWIDAISIDQQNNDEKSWQVGMMRDIYKDAKDVLVWLGPAADNSDNVLNGLEKVGRRVCDYLVLMNWQYKFASMKWFSREFPGLNLGPDDPTLEQLLPNFGIDDTPDATIPATATATFLVRPWWRRVWVLQELGMAKEATFICGSERISYELLAPAICRYVALSYVWGRSTKSFLTLKRENITTLNQKNSLKGVILPQTVKDATYLCKDYGERYLWVDSLCIVQD